MVNHASSSHPHHHQHYNAVHAGMRFISQIGEELSRQLNAAPIFPIHAIQVLTRTVNEGLSVALPNNNTRNRSLLLACSSLAGGAVAAVAAAPPIRRRNREDVSERLDGVPVYTVSNMDNEFVLISDSSGQRSLGLFCFRYEDAEALLAQIKDKEPNLGRNSKVVAVSLDKVYRLKTEGIAFRFLPDPRQVKHALESRAKAGDSEKAFDGVPVFQSDNLILRNDDRRFCPIFFSKEDLDKALHRAFKQQQRVNSSLRVQTDIQVGSFEDVLQQMESGPGWDDVVFVPPGMDAFKHIPALPSSALRGHK